MKVQVSELIGPALDWAVAKCLGASIGKPNCCENCRFYREEPGPDGGLDYCSEGEYRELEFWGKDIGALYGVHSSCGLKDTDAPLYSTNWALGGPIIEREKIDITYLGGDEWEANRYFTNTPSTQRGISPLIAAMRCYVATKLGKEIDIPEELVKGLHLLDWSCLHGLMRLRKK